MSDMVRESLLLLRSGLRIFNRAEVGNWGAIYLRLFWADDQLLNVAAHPKCLICNK